MAGVEGDLSEGTLWRYLYDHRGEKNVLVMFYPFAFTGTCTGELCAIRDRYTDLVAFSLRVSLRNWPFFQRSNL